MTKIYLTSVCIALGLIPRLSYSWDNHALGTISAISRLPQMTQSPPVQAESIESFLNDTQLDLAKLLGEEEHWAQVNIPNYPPLADSLYFQSENNPFDVRQNFLRAIRVNPTILLALYNQEIPGRSYVFHPSLPASEVTLLPQSLSSSERFVSITSGEEISPIDVIAAASDEPDYGLDIGLWQDNGTSFGAEYQFGQQPFGNPVVDFSSQGPFHMGYYHESKLAYNLASYLSRTYPEYRIHLYDTLAKFAFQKGHPYWGFRFAGWTLHYIQDLTQPYHSTAFPGFSLFTMILYTGLEKIGLPKSMTNAIQLITNRHLALENYEYEVLSKALGENDDAHPVLQVLENITSEEQSLMFSPEYVRDTVSAESNRIASHVSKILLRSLPYQLVSDPQYLFSITDPNVNVLDVLDHSSNRKQSDMQEILSRLMIRFGVHTRIYLNSLSSLL